MRGSGAIMFYALEASSWLFVKDLGRLDCYRYHHRCRYRYWYRHRYGYGYCYRYLYRYRYLRLEGWGLEDVDF